MRLFDSGFRLAESFLKSRNPPKDAKDGGVRNKFMNKYTWYEEYPFSDGLYVLNGFMYSMIGLYDLLSADGAPEDLKITAKEIFYVGFESLKVKFRREKLNNSHKNFRKCFRYTTMGREQITICDITSNQLHLIVRDGTTMWCMYIS